MFINVRAGIVSRQVSDWLGVSAWLAMTLNRAFQPITTLERTQTWCWFQNAQSRLCLCGAYLKEICLVQFSCFCKGYTHWNNRKITQDSSQIRIAFSVRGLITHLSRTQHGELTLQQLRCLAYVKMIFCLFGQKWSVVRQIGPIRGRDSLVYSRYLNTVLFLTIKGRVYLRSN